jgi:hypothetical protein
VCVHTVYVGDHSEKCSVFNTATSKHYQSFAPKTQLKQDCHGNYLICTDFLSQNVKTHPSTTHGLPFYPECSQILSPTMHRILAAYFQIKYGICNLSIRKFKPHESYPTISGANSKQLLKCFFLLLHDPILLSNRLTAKNT